MLRKKNAKRNRSQMQRRMRKENFVQNLGLLDNLVAEDRHEIGCESLESHFHKAQGLVAQTRG